MKQLREDLWQTTPGTEDNINCSFLLQRPEGNVLFYNTMTEDDVSEMAELGGVAHHVLSHRHEAGQGPWQLVRKTFGAQLCCDALEAAAMEGDIHADVVFDQSGGRLGNLEVHHAPGHTEGGINCVYRSPHGQTYLFCGDNLVPVNGYWLATIVAEDGGDAAILADSISKFRDLKPDMILSSTAVGQLITEMDRDKWGAAIDANVRLLSRK